MLTKINTSQFFWKGRFRWGWDIKDPSLGCGVVFKVFFATLFYHTLLITFLFRQILPSYELNISASILLYTPFHYPLLQIGAVLQGFTGAPIPGAGTRLV